MRTTKGVSLFLAAIVIAALVAHVPGPVSFVHAVFGALGVLALDSLVSALWPSITRGALASVGSALGELVGDRIFRKHVLDKWAKRGVRLHYETNDEIAHLIEKGGGKLPKLHSYNPFTGQGADQGGVEGRIEENYLYSTRRFPLNTANNTIGSGAVAAGDYNFFTSGVGDAGSAMGYFSIANLTYVQTNMAPSGKIPNGRGFKLFDLGVSFNAAASASDIAQLLDTCSLAFQKQAGQLKVYHGPLQLWPGGVGLAGFAATTATTTTIAGASNGQPNLSNQRRSSNPRILSANDDFQYVVTALAATPNSQTTVALSAFVEMRVSLYGFVLDKIPN